ncbi:MAG TPA: hypothetical protein EYG82_07200 [Sulfurovum sp.]|nr:hypothetical protein [Sulfurovum sp.]
MKNGLESFALLLVGLLSVGIIYLIVQYNLVDDGDAIDEIAYEIPQKQKVSSKAKAEDYLQNLEGYEDVDVKVDATKEDTVNTVVIQSQVKDDELTTAVEDKSKSSYMENLENYADKAKEEKLDTIKPTADGEGDPEKLDQEEIVDEIGMAIDAALDGI